MPPTIVWVIFESLHLTASANNVIANVRMSTLLVAAISPITICVTFFYLQHLVAVLVQAVVSDLVQVLATVGFEWLQQLDAGLEVVQPTRQKKPTRKKKCFIVNVFFKVQFWLFY